MPSAQTSPAIVALTVTRPVPARQARHRHGRCSSNRLYPSGQNANYKFPGPQAASFEVGRASLEAGCMHLFECEATFEAEQAIVEAGQEDTGRAQDATAESHDRGVR